ncbi:MAG: class I SAM-dependent methyltransferase [Pseudomonadota bacterium]|nr:class I SAM-dependent methyltransferase [Pseudomonadota bacterium]
MPIPSTPSFPKSDYKDYPRTLAADDLWGQVRRTVNGKPVSEDQIELIVAAIRAGLALRPADRVLDLACGNGALSRYFFDDCASLHGVDFSAYLIEVAQRHFERPPRFAFTLGDAAGYVSSEPDPTRFDKVLCYGSFPFFSEADGATVLRELHRRFVNVQRVFIGNLPDRDRADRFYPAGTDYTAALDDPAAAIGLWRTADDWRTLAAAHGWRASIHHMPQAFYAAHYRFDVVLDRA